MNETEEKVRGEKNNNNRTDRSTDGKKGKKRTRILHQSVHLVILTRRWEQEFLIDLERESFPLQRILCVSEDFCHDIKLIQREAGREGRSGREGREGEEDNKRK